MSGVNLPWISALIFAIFLMSLGLAMAFVLILRASPLAAWSIDRPNHRSLHVRPVPRIGGPAMALAIVMTFAVFRPENSLGAILPMALCLALVSLLDDRMDLPAALRLTFHAIAALIVAIGWLAAFAKAPAELANDSRSWLTSPFWIVAAIAAVCWMTNLFNFMDGANGMAGGMAFVGFTGYAIAAMVHPSTGSAIAAASAACAGAALGFLVFNFPSARIFMGDSGSVPFGFLAACFGIQGKLVGLWDWWFGVLVFSPFIVDATVTLLKRAMRGERFWVAHREHYYQRLILLGWSHRKTVASYYILMLGSTVSALAAQNTLPLYPVVSFWVITYISLLLYLEWRFYQHNKTKTEDTAGVK